MSKEVHQVGVENGVKYTLTYQKRIHQMACDTEYHNEWRWWLTVEGEYIGDFRTKTEAMTYVSRETTGEQI